MPHYAFLGFSKERTDIGSRILLKRNGQHGFGLLELIVATALGAMLCLGIFTFFDTMQILYQRQVGIEQLQEDTRFLTLFLREKIQSAGDWSCESDGDKPQSVAISRYTSDEALEKLELHIKENTDLLQLHECVRFQNKLQYLPVNFFIANTSRGNDALFIEIDKAAREELITGMTDFQVHLYHSLTEANAVIAVKIEYVLSSVNPVITKNNVLHQSGILYVARRNALS